MALAQLVRDGRYLEALAHDIARPLITDFIDSIVAGSDDAIVASQSTESAAPRLTSRSSRSRSRSPGGAENVLAVGLAAFNAFLQSNVTGPVLEGALVRHLYTGFNDAYAHACTTHQNRNNGAPAPLSLSRLCLQSLDVDGVSVYPYIPHIELFCLARSLLFSFSDQVESLRAQDEDPATQYLPWLRLRIQVWHFKLLTQPTLGPGSVFNKSLQWTDLSSLQTSIEQLLDEAQHKVFAETASGSDVESRLAQQQFLLEKAGIYIMLGMDAKAKTTVKDAARISQMSYVLSGALGKRTRFQETSTSQLVVLATSARREQSVGHSGPQIVPDTLPLNDDTLLENLTFAPSEGVTRQGPPDSVPLSLRDIVPDNQPQLAPLDQIVLLAEATVKDAFSPADSLTSEEILPYAVRVISDKSTNWQIYTHALLIRSRIEVHRSRTMERGILQMQALVDQIIVDSSDGAEPKEPKPKNDTQSVPTIRIAGPDGDLAPATKENKPTSFFPAPKSTESAPAQSRLRYIHVLLSPPRWHLESEVGYAWAGAGSLMSALEIFKRLRLWAEVALCYASSASAEDPDGRGSGGEEKARAILRWRLFQPGSQSQPANGHVTKAATTSGDTQTTDIDLETDVDISSLDATKFMGPERQPPPSNAPRLFCILGDIEDNPRHYERSWELSHSRYARAQKLLGEYHLRRQEWVAAREAYKKAVTVNRLSTETWSRLGDINLRLGSFSDAAEAFSRAIGAANDVVGGEDARTWSNLGSAFYSLYVETIEGKKKTATTVEEEIEGSQHSGGSAGDAGQSVPTEMKEHIERDPAALLTQSLTAYKRGASIAHDNWRIWDNVITLAARARPPVISDILQALHRVIAIRQSEDAVDDEVLRLVLTHGLLNKPSPPDGIPARGSQEKAICDLVENQVAPLVTQRSELWELVTRERAWRGDLEGAIDAAEKAWRTAMGGVGGATLGATAGASVQGRDWLTDREAWATVVARTDELVSVLENYGPGIDSIGTRWKGKARSALRSIMGKAKASWEGDEGWQTLENLMDGLKAGA